MLTYAKQLYVMEEMPNGKMTCEERNEICHLTSYAKMIDKITYFMIKSGTFLVENHKTLWRVNRKMKLCMDLLLIIKALKH